MRPATEGRSDRADLVCRHFRYGFNERSGTVFNRLKSLTDQTFLSRAAVQSLRQRADLETDMGLHAALLLLMLWRSHPDHVDDQPEAQHSSASDERKYLI
jgi:hypothetical protein